MSKKIIYVVGTKTRKMEKRKFQLDDALFLATVIIPFLILLLFVQKI